MADTEQPQTEAPAPEDLARDVARLYSFVQTEEIPYRVFSRPSKPRTAAHPPQKAPAPAPAVPEPEPPAIEAEAKPEPQPQAQAAIPPAIAPPAAAAPAIEIKKEPAPQAIPAPPETVSKPPLSSGESQAGQKTAIAIVSIAGGVGKTTLAANLGRILSSQHEHVLLVDASGSGLLPFYFGADGTHPGLRTFLAPEPDMPPIRILGAEQVTHQWIEDDVKPAMRAAQRTIFDLGPASHSLLPEILPLCAVILIPLVVDLNSIMSIPRVEAHNNSMRTVHGLTDLPKPLYILNKLDAASKREQHGRELISQQTGARLLPFAIRRSPEIGDAIAGRMTVADYAPESEIAKDFIQLASWIKKAAPVTEPVTHRGRWSEA